MAGRLHDLWSAWTSGALPSWLVLVILVVSTLAWLSASVVTAREASRRYANPFGWATIVTATVVAALSLSLLAPHSFPWFAVGAGAAAALGALAARWLIDRGQASCARGHQLAGSWVHCPHCPPGRAASATHGMAAPGTRIGQEAPGGYGLGGMRAPVAVPHVGYSPPPHRPVEPPRQTMIRLIAETRGVSDQIVTDRGALLGRNPAADVLIDDQAASWDHARIVDRGGSPAVVDLGSSNGTYVNEERVETSLLITGDRLRIGETVFKVVST